MNFKQFESHHLVNPKYTSVDPVRKIENRKIFKRSESKTIKHLTRLTNFI